MTEPDLSLEPLERLRVALLTYFTYVERHARAYVALLRGGVGADAEVAAIIDSVRQTYVRRVLQSLPEGEQPTPLLHIAITGWVGFVETTSLAWLEQPGLDKTQLCKLAVRVLLAALQGVRESSSGLAGATGEARS